MFDWMRSTAGSTAASLGLLTHPKGTRPSRLGARLRTQKPVLHPSCWSLVLEHYAQPECPRRWCARQASREKTERSAHASCDLRELGTGDRDRKSAVSLEYVGHEHGPIDRLLQRVLFTATGGEVAAGTPSSCQDPRMRARLSEVMSGLSKHSVRDLVSLCHRLEGEHVRKMACRLRETDARHGDLTLHWGNLLDTVHAFHAPRYENLTQRAWVRLTPFCPTQVSHISSKPKRQGMVFHTREQASGD